MAFRVGERVICVNARVGDFKNPKIGIYYINSLDGLKRGAIYTISQVGYCAFHKHATVWLKEIDRRADSLYPDGVPFAAARFRLLQETGMSILKAILANPHKQLETVE